MYDGLSQAAEAARTGGVQGRIPGLVNSSNEPVYDSEIVLTTTTRFRLFTVPIGQTSPGGLAKSRLSTNMTVAGRLPDPQSMEIRGIRFQYFTAKDSTDNLADARLVLEGAYAVLNVGGKDEWTSPLYYFNAGFGVNLAVAIPAAAAAAVSSVSNGVPNAHQFVTFREAIPVGRNQDFYVEVVFDAAPAALTKSTGRLVCFLEGVKYQGVR
jgi:hypothetical protein